jgi:DNA-binding CsgD family transcriptional regulator
MPTEIVGRGPELESVDEALAAARGGLAGIVFEGVAGIGKTTVWREAISRADAAGYRVLRCRASESEARLSYSGLTDLLGPVEEEAFAGLPEPQRLALDVALLRAAAKAPAERRAVSAGIVSLLGNLACDGPVALAIDDVQWLDTATSRALEFAVRRLEELPLVVVGTRRVAAGQPTPPLLAALPSGRVRVHRLGPLSLAGLHTVLKNQLGVSVPRPLLARIEATSGGNPFFALEIARAAQAGGELSRTRDLRLPDDLRTLLVARIRRLPPRTRDELLVASALSVPTTSLVSEDELAPAEEAGLVTVEGRRVGFTHPLLAAAVYSSATAARRRSVHLRLAGEVDDEEERARHLALATTLPGEDVATQIEAGAARARQRGVPDAAGELEEAAARLTPPADVRGRCRRLTVAASHHFHAGDSQRARELVEAVLAEAPHGRERGDALRVLGELRYHESSYAEATALLEEALTEDDAPDFVVEVTFALSYTVFSCGDMVRALALAQSALEQAEELGNDALLAQALALVAVGEGYIGPGVDWSKLDRAVALEDRSWPIPIHLRPSVLAAELAGYEGRLSEARMMLDELRAWFVERGEESDLPYLLFHLATTTWSAGEFRATIAASSEALGLAEQAGSETMQGLALAHRARAHAALGDVSAALADLERGRALLEPSGWAWGLVLLAFAAAFLALSLDDAGRADAAYGPLGDALEAMMMPWVTAEYTLPDAVEAAVGAGDPDRAERMLAAWEARFAELGHPPLLAATARCRSLVCLGRGDLDGALAAADEALAWHEQAESPLELARTLLVKGQAERRLRQRAAARRSLERSLAICERLGAGLWAERVRGELSRLGPRVDPGELTATELRVAELAASGLTNVEIAARLSISRRTVEANLARSYSKLGIRSRAQLGAALAARAD